MSKVLQETGFGSLPSSIETNPRDQVKSISTTIEADSHPIRRIGSPQYVVSTGQNRIFMYETRQTTIPFPSRLNGYYCDGKKGSYGPQFSEAYTKASHTNESIPQKEKDPGKLGELAHTKLTAELADRTVKYPKGIAENVLVRIEKITLRVGEEKIIFKSVKPASSIIKRVYMLSLRERMELDLEARLMGETLVLYRSLDPFLEGYIELNDLSEPFKLRRSQCDDLMPTIEEGEVIEEYRTKYEDLNTRIDDYPSYYDGDKKIYIDCAHNLKFSCMIGFEFTHVNFFLLLYVNVMSKKFHKSIMKNKMVYKGDNVVGALMNVPIFVGTFSVVTDFTVLEDMDAYRDKGMGNVIVGEPFLREVGIKARRFDGMITIYNFNDEIMSPRIRTQSAGRPAAESIRGGTSVQFGRAGRGRRPREGNDERVDDLNGQGNDQGMGANRVVEGVNGNVEGANKGAPDFSTIITQQFQNLLPAMLAQVSNRGNVGNQNGNVVNENVQDNVGNVIVNGNQVGCSYKEFLACNLKEYDGKGGVVVLTRWIQKIEFVHDMSGCSVDQKVKYTSGSFVEFYPSHEMQKLESELWNHAMVGAGHAAYTDRFHELARLVPYLVTPKSMMIERYVYGLAPQIYRMVAATEPKTIQKAVQISGALTDEAVRNGSIKKVEKRGNVGEPSKDKNGRDDNKRTRTGNAFATTVNPVGRENTGTWPKCTTCNSYHAPGGPCRTCFNCNRPGHLAKDCRGVPRNVNPVNARNPTVRACYECGSTDHVRLRTQIDKVIKGCKLEIEGYVFDIDLIPFGHGSFDVIIAIDPTTQIHPPMIDGMYGCDWQGAWEALKGLEDTQIECLSAGLPLKVSCICACPFAICISSGNTKLPLLSFLGTGPNWMFDIDTLTMSMNYQPVFARNQTNGNAGTKANIDAGQAGKKTVSHPAKAESQGMINRHHHTRRQNREN
ncbi:putative reverse transcriptase domain-containing protein [Tanacetum coccineum]